MVKKINPFAYSNDNKRYHTFNYYLRNNYHNKVFKIPLDAGFTCPNRDGHLGYGGCSFCSQEGSGDTIVNDTLQIQLQSGYETMSRKWPNGKAMAYFQAYSNTYESLDNLKTLYDPFFRDERFVAISIATRADCLSDEIIDYLKDMSQVKDLWLEIGLQSIHETTNHYINRGHSTDLVKDVIEKLKGSKIKTCLHIINGLPNETEEMMFETAKYVAKLKVDAIKIHMFHVIERTLEAYRYKQNPYPLLSMEEFSEIVIRQLEILPPQMIIQRLSGDGLPDDLVAPLWTTKKINLLNHIDKTMANRNTYQGRLYEEY